MKIPKDREQAVLEWFDAQPKNEDGSVTIKHDGAQHIPIELLGINREQLKSIPHIKIGAKVSPPMIDRLLTIKIIVDNLV